MKNQVERVVVFTVTEEAMRPASDKRQCFYCQQAIGEVHKPNCVLISRKVKVRMTVEYEVEVPAHWDKSNIEFHRNEGSWCTNNAIDELTSIFEGEEENGCMCSCTEFEYLGGDTNAYLTE